ncbi:MAG: hypothetical protein HQL91_07340 [Magnetococcales bacterium]|nr:hypothetical protein [Magnetococcales bacterium]
MPDHDSSPNDARFCVPDPLLTLEAFCRKKLEQPGQNRAASQLKEATELLLAHRNTRRSHGEKLA